LVGTPTGFRNWVEMMIIRYVLGRPVPPVAPQVLKGGKVSTNKLRDTTAALYLSTCQTEGLEPNAEYVEHLKQRDSEAWVFKYDMYSGDDLLNAALYDAQLYQKAIASSSLLPPKNGFACEMCSWRSHCESDPMATAVDEWPNVGTGREPSELRVKYGRTVRTLSRDRRGFVVSPSEIRAFAKCNRLWALEYRWRMRQTYEGPKALPRIRGSLTHDCLQLLGESRMNAEAKHFATAEDLKVELGVRVAEMFSAGQIDHEAHEELTANNGIAAIADRALSMFALAMDGVSEIVEVERRRIVKMPGSKKWLHGIPDMVVRLDSGRLAIVEYKTTSKTKNLPALADRYRTNPAVHLYAALVRFGQLTF
jgi:hypothetical protein